MVEQIESRARIGRPSTSVTLQGRPVESHKIRRYMKKKARDDARDMVLITPSNARSAGTGAVLPFVNSMYGF